MIDSGFIEEGPGSGGILALHEDMGVKLVARFLLVSQVHLIPKSDIQKPAQYTKVHFIFNLDGICT